MAKRGQTIPLSDIMPDPGNVRIHDERNQRAIRASLTRFGPGRSIVLDGNNIVRAGNGTLEQCPAAGIDEVLVVEPKPNQIVAVRRPDWDDTTATAYSLGDNHTTDLSKNDPTAEAQILESIRGSDETLLEAMGYDKAEVDGLIDRMKGEVVEDPQGEWQGMPEFESEDQKPFRTLHVHFRDADDVQKFGEMIGQAIPEKADYLWVPPRPIEHPSRVQYASES